MLTYGGARWNATWGSAVPRDASPTPFTRKKEITMTKSRHKDTDAGTVAGTGIVAVAVAVEGLRQLPQGVANPARPPKLTLD